MFIAWTCSIFPLHSFSYGSNSQISSLAWEFSLQSNLRCPSAYSKSLLGHIRISDSTALNLNSAIPPPFFFPFWGFISANGNFLAVVQAKTLRSSPPTPHPIPLSKLLAISIDYFQKVTTTSSSLAAILAPVKVPFGCDYCDSPLAVLLLLSLSFFFFFTFSCSLSLLFQSSSTFSSHSLISHPPLFAFKQLD